MERATVVSGRDRRRDRTDVRGDHRVSAVRTIESKPSGKQHATLRQRVILAARKAFGATAEDEAPWQTVSGMILIFGLGALCVWCVVTLAA